MEYTGCDEVFQGILPEAEKCFPAYDLITDINPHPVDYQILHTSRGCERHCAFCGTWKIEPKFIAETTIKAKIRFKKLVFYDNNFLANPHIERILEELIELKTAKQILWCESQSGFDARILTGKKRLAELLKNAGFRNPRIAWDGPRKDYKKIGRAIEILASNGFPIKEISVFVLYNWDLSFDEMEQKRIQCWQWGVQVADCRNRPLNQLFDNYRPRLRQTSKDYYIHEIAGWTDALVKQFRKNVREHNICVRQDYPVYAGKFERMQVDKELIAFVNGLPTVQEKIDYLNAKQIYSWHPGNIRYPTE